MPGVLLRGRVGAAQDEHLVRPRGPRGPQLLPGDDDLVAVDLALGLQPGQVRAGPGLGEALAVHVLAGDDPGQEVGLLLGRAVHDDRGADQALAHAADDARYARPVQLLVEDRDADGVQALAAELLRPLRADEALLLQFRFPLRVGRMLHRVGAALAAVAAGGDDVVPVGEIGQAWRGVPGDPVPRLAAELVDLRAKVKFHGASPGWGRFRASATGQILESRSRPMKSWSRGRCQGDERGPSPVVRPSPARALRTVSELALGRLRRSCWLSSRPT